ncbi:MAG: nitrite reductase small subunit NirD [Betaproteobacteria bacterium]
MPGAGVGALVDGRQVAVFRLDDDSVHALGNYDPFSKANVLSRGIVGDLKGELVVASPVYKQHFSLATGACLEDAAVSVPVYGARVQAGMVQVEHTQVATTCCYCGVGCGVVASASKGKIYAVAGERSHPANFGRLCTKGSTLHLSTDQRHRLLYPELRTSRDGARQRVSWERALDHAAARFAECIARHGPDSVAFYISGQLLTEDYYVFNKLAKGLIGTNNVDTNSRLCMASAVAGYKLSLGADAPPCSYEDLERAHFILIAGSNTAFAHPVVYQRIADARAANPALRVVVVDPRATVTARSADAHLAIKPGTDVALFNAMLHVIVGEGLLNRAFFSRTEGFAAMKPLLEYWTPQRAAAVCELPVKSIVETARSFAKAKAALSLYCQGLNQSANGTFKNSALINLHLATGQIGRPGAGPFSLTGQPNAMGGREVGGMANLLCAHRDLASEKDRAEVAALWGVPSVPAKPGKTAVELFEALEAGEVKMIWVACTNPAHSMPDVTAVRRALRKAEFVVVQEAFAGAETCDYADLLFPAATWGEKEGTVTNSERRISRVRAAAPPPGEARADWKIVVDFARRMGGARLFPYETPQQIFDEHRETTRGRDLDITGLSYALLDERGPQQWPYPEGATEGRKRLYADGVFATPSGKARFVVAEHVAPAEEPDEDYPLRLITGRLRDQWHTMTRTGTVARLFSHSPEPEVLLHPRDVPDADLVRVSSRRGSVVLKARASDEMRPGEAFVAMHWGSRFMAGEGMNALTLPALDPMSKQPELKHAAVRVEPFRPAWRSARTGRQPQPALLEHFDYAAVTLRENGDVALQAAAQRAPDGRTLEALQAMFPGEENESPERSVCACFNVREGAIRAALAAGATLARLQRDLKCGTNCGSCMAELRRLVA